MERGERVGIWLHVSEYGVWVVAEALVLEWKWIEGIGSRMSEHGVWVVAEALVLEWKGKRGWGYGHACLNMQVKEAGVGGG